MEELTGLLLHGLFNMLSYTAQYYLFRVSMASTGLGPPIPIKKRLRCKGDLVATVVTPLMARVDWGSGWLSRCPLPPSLLHVYPSRSCMPGRRGRPSLNRGRLVSSQGYTRGCTPLLEPPNKLSRKGSTDLPISNPI